MRKRIFLETSAVIASAAILLLIAGSFVQLRRWHVSGWRGALYDQAGYVSTSRNLATTHLFTSNVIYTSTLKQKASKNYLYMPGHYCILALSFALGGVGPVQSVIPSLLGYCIAAGCVYLSGRKLHGRAAGLIAAGLFILLPVNLAFAFTAMSELTFIAAASVAFCIFVHLPPRLRVWGGPLLLALPFLFRETGSLLVLPMAGIILAGAGVAQQTIRQRWGHAALFCLLSVGLLGGVYLSPLSKGRPSLLKMMLFDVPALNVYYDATAADKLPNTKAAWAKAVRGNIDRNVAGMRVVLNSRPQGLEAGVMGSIALAMVLALAYGVWRRDAWAVCCGLMVLVAVALIFALYSSSGFRGMRNLMFTWPFLSIAAAALIAHVACRGWWGRMLTPVGTAAAAGSVLLAGQLLAIFSTNDKEDDAMLAFVESIGHDPNRMLASTCPMGLPYVAKHYPAKWAFLPLNGPTLSLLVKKYDVGTLIVPPGLTTIRRQQYAKAGFVLEREVEFRQQKIAVYRRDPQQPPRGRRGPR